MLPSLFISHGSPMLALQPGASGEALTRLAADLQRPEAILIVSAHWENESLLLTAGAIVGDIASYDNAMRLLQAAD